MKKILYAFLICQALLFSANAFSQTGVFLKAEAPGFSFNGGATHVGYVNQVEVFSFSDGIAGCITPNKNCVSSYSGFNFMTKFTLATIDFMSVQLQGKTITSADAVWVKITPTGAFEKIKIHMEEVKVSSVQESGSTGGDDSPTISISLQPAKIAWKVITQNADGSAGPSNSYGWDFSKNVAFNYSFP